MHKQTESHEDPGQIWRIEHQHPEEGKSRVWITARPDVNERLGQGVAEEWNPACEAAEGEERNCAVQQEPGEAGGGGAGGRFEESAIAGHEEQVEEEIEGGWAEVDECREEAPVLQMLLPPLLE